MKIFLICIAVLAFVFCVVYFSVTISPAKRQKRIEGHIVPKGIVGVGDTAAEMIRREKVLRVLKWILCYGFLIVMGTFMFLPFYWMIVTSLKTEGELGLLVPTFFPKVLAVSNYPLAITRLNAWRLLWNTLVVGVFSTLGTLITTVISAYAFSRLKFPGRELIFTIFLATMMIPGEMMVITNFITISRFPNGNNHPFLSLGINSYWAMIVPFMISVYYIYLLRQNFRQIPDELYYAAKVDGTSDFKYLIKVMIPMAMPTLITISILKLMGAWNAYVWPMMVTTKADMRLITTGLRSAFSGEEGRTAQGLQMAATTVVTAPLLLVFIFLRKYIMRGVSRSGIKG